MILSPQARRIWDELAPQRRLRVLNQVWCVKCMKSTSMGKVTGKVEKGRLTLSGVCTSCGGVVATSVDPQQR
jgi:rRNA maturation protein Nop10